MANILQLKNWNFSGNYLWFWYYIRSLISLLIGICFHLIGLSLALCFEQVDYWWRRHHSSIPSIASGINHGIQQKLIYGKTTTVRLRASGSLPQRAKHLWNGIQGIHSYSLFASSNCLLIILSIYSHRNRTSIGPTWMANTWLTPRTWPWNSTMEVLP